MALYGKHFSLKAEMKFINCNILALDVLIFGNISNKILQISSELISIILIMIEMILHENSTVG